MYLSFRQLPRRLMTTIVRVEGDAVATAPRLAAALGEIAPSSAVDWVDAVPSFLAWLHRDTTFRLTLVLSFAASALVLTIAGVYALFAQQVLRTHHEIGVRKALGASDARIAARVLGSAVGVLATGVVAGVVLGLAAGRLMQGLLYGVPAADVVAVAGACGLLSVLVLLAVLGPALRAARVVPLDALRCE
jgi:ABC-type antimicrobial peptide transport system permease subunit